MAYRGNAPPDARSIVMYLESANADASIAPTTRWISYNIPPGTTEIQEGMVFALETYCPATDGYSAARIEEEVVVTDKGCRVITHFPAEELPIANAY